MGLLCWERLLGSLPLPVTFYPSIYEPVRAIGDESDSLYLKRCPRDPRARKIAMSRELRVSPDLACLAKDGRDRKQDECHSPAGRSAMRVSQLPAGCGWDGSASSESKARARLLGTIQRGSTNIPTIASPMVIETQVHRTGSQRPHAFWYKIELWGSRYCACGIPFGSPEIQENTALDLRGRLLTDIPLVPQVHGLSWLRRAHLLAVTICFWPWTAPGG